MRVRPRVIGRIEDRVERLLIHQVDKNLPERLATGVELSRRFFERRARGRWSERAFEAARAHRRQLARREQILDRQHAIARLRAAREIGRPAIAQRTWSGATRERVPRVVIGNRHVDHRGAGGLQLRDHAGHVLGHLALPGEADETLAQRANAFALERGGIEAGGEGSGDVFRRIGRDRVFGIRPRHQIERQGDVANRFPHRADRVVVGVERHHAGAAGQPARGADGGQRGKAGRIRKGVARVGAEAERGKTRRDRGGAPATRTRGAERGVVGVAHGAADRADAEVAEWKLIEVRLAEHHGSAALHPGRDP